jgi:hypothetical protein
MESTSSLYKNNTTVLALAACVGIGATLYTVNASETRKQEKEARQARRRQKRIAKLRMQAEEEEPRHAVLYFNDKDEMVEAKQGH